MVANELDILVTPSNPGSRLRGNIPALVGSRSLPGGRTA